MTDVSHHFIKLTGKANIPEALKNGHAYNVVAKGQVTAETLSDNQNGTFTAYYKFEPILVDIVGDMGEVIKAEDTRSMSQKVRKAHWGVWQRQTDDPRSAEDAYEDTMKFILAVLPDLYKRARGDK